MTPEFSRPERVETIGDSPRTIAINADETERARLAARFGLVSIERLAATFSVRRDAAGALADGRVAAALTQACSVTGDPLAVTIEEPVSLRFVDRVATGEEVELSDDALDTIEIAGGAVDLGEIAAETVALALDPFPRGPGAEAALKAAGVIAEDQVRPFNAFAALKDQLGKKT